MLGGQHNLNQNDECSNKGNNLRMLFLRIINVVAALISEVEFGLTSSPVTGSEKKSQPTFCLTAVMSTPLRETRSFFTLANKFYFHINTMVLC